MELIFFYKESTFSLIFLILKRFGRFIGSRIMIIQSEHCRLLILFLNDLMTFIPVIATAVHHNKSISIVYLVTFTPNWQHAEFWSITIQAIEILHLLIQYACNKSNMSKLYTFKHIRTNFFMKSVNF